ncbi:MAG: oligoendopeptidase F, partial [Pseudolabrys sp.]
MAKSATRKKPSKSDNVASKPASKPAGRAVTKPGTKLGNLPGWDLNDLYPGLESPALKRDLEIIATQSAAFEADYKGKLAALAAVPSAPGLLAAVKRYEALSDVLGRIGSYSGLLHATDSTNQTYSKFYGDMSERITNAFSHLLFFDLEINRIDDAVLEAALADPALRHYKPWFDDVRLEKPYQLEDRVEELFHEKSLTGYSAWNRQYDDIVASLRFKIGGKVLGIEQALNFMQDADGKKRKAAAEALGKTFKENLRPFTLITNTLAKDKEISDRWRGFKDVAASRHLANRVEPEVVEALVSSVRAAYPKLSHRYYALKARWFGKKSLAYWDRNAPLPQVAQRTIPWTDARATVLTAYGAFSPRMAEVADTFFEKNWIDAPVRAGKQPGAFAHPTVPSAHPYV